MELLFRWEVTSVVVALLVSIGLGVLALNDFKLAKLFFSLSAADAIGGAAMAFNKSGLSPWAAGIAVFLCCGVIGLMLWGSFRYVDRKENEKRSDGRTAAPAEPATSTHPLPTALSKPKPKDIASAAKTHKDQSTEPKVHPVPAGFISFLGQILNGMAVMMQENQTTTPLDDVKLQIIASVPVSETEWTGPGKRSCPAFS